MFCVYPVYAELRSEPRRANPTRSLYPVYPETLRDPRRKPRSERTRKALRALCVLCVKTHLQPRPGPGVAVHPDPLGAFTSLSLSSFRNFQTFQLSNLSTSPRANSHRIIFFAHPHPLTPIESYSYKKQGGGVPLTQCHGRWASCLCATRRNPHNSNPFMGVRHNSRTPPPRGGGSCFQRREVQLSSQCPRVPEHRSRDSGQGTRVTEHGPLLTTHYPLLTLNP